MKISSYNSHDCRQFTAVSVIASLRGLYPSSISREGKVRPLYLQIGDNSYKVLSYYVKETSEPVTEFVCEIDDHGFLRSFPLYYYARERIWTI
jgi:hypothetical protein